MTSTRPPSDCKSRRCRDEVRGTRIAEQYSQSQRLLPLKYTPPKDESYLIGGSHTDSGWSAALPAPNDEA